jgi:hypothetical protein
MTEIKKSLGKYVIIFQKITYAVFLLNRLIAGYLTSSSVNWARFTNERVEYNVFLFEEPFRGSKSVEIFKISLTFRFDKLWHLSGENSQILTVSKKKL